MKKTERFDGARQIYKFQTNLKHFDDSTQQEHFQVLKELERIKNLGKYDGESYKEGEFEKFINSDECYKSHYYAVNDIAKSAIRECRNLKIDHIKDRIWNSKKSKNFKYVLRKNILKCILTIKQKDPDIFKSDSYLEDVMQKIKEIASNKS